jgi:tight adherence protein B
MQLTPDQRTLVLVIAGVLVLIIIGVMVWQRRREEDIGEQRLTKYQETSFASFAEAEAEGQDKKKKNQPSGMTLALDGMVSKSKFGQQWRQQLARADLKMTVGEYFASHFFAAAVFALISYFVVFQFQVVMAILAAFAGLIAPRIYVNRLTADRLTKFEQQLPDTLSLWVNSLRSGYSVLQAMEAISKDSPEPTSTEFRRVVQEVQLGIDMDDALKHLLERIESEDLDLVLTAVTIQREVGGNLAEIMEVIGGTIRERIKLKGEIAVLTAQGRITGYLISFLPIILALFLNSVNPSYMGDLFTNRACGWPMIGVGLALIGIGSALIQKIMDIEM